MRMFCKSMIQIAHNFNCNAVAVGVETGEDAQEAGGVGCDIVQGYRFGRPMTEEQLIAMIEAGRAQSSNFVVWVP